MTKKAFVVILGISVAIWYLSRVAQALTELYILESPSISLYPTSNNETGYPIALNLSQSDNNLYFYYLINIAFWFVVIWGIWKVLLRTKSKK